MTIGRIQLLHKTVEKDRTPGQRPAYPAGVRRAGRDHKRPSPAPRYALPSPLARASADATLSRHMLHTAAVPCVGRRVMPRVERRQFLQRLVGQTIFGTPGPA